MVSGRKPKYNWWKYKKEKKNELVRAIQLKDKNRSGDRQIDIWVRWWHGGCDGGKEDGTLVRVLRLRGGRDRGEEDGTLVGGSGRRQRVEVQDGGGMCRSRVQSEGAAGTRVLPVQVTGCRCKVKVQDARVQWFRTYRTLLLTSLICCLLQTGDAVTGTCRVSRVDILFRPV